MTRAPSITSSLTRTSFLLLAAFALRAPSLVG
jgi:hypothetical protein